MASKLRTVSWVWLTLIGVAILLISLESAHLAYRGPFSIGGVPLDQLAAGREVVLTALRGARGTAASYAFGFGLLYLLVVLVPYRSHSALVSSVCLVHSGIYLLGVIPN